MYKSSKQMAYMHAAADRGDIPRKVVEEFDRESKGKKIPMRKGKSDLLGRRKAMGKSNLTGNP